MDAVVETPVTITLSYGGHTILAETLDTDVPVEATHVEGWLPLLVQELSRFTPALDGSGHKLRLSFGEAEICALQVKDGERDAERLLADLTDKLETVVYQVRLAAERDARTILHGDSRYFGMYSDRGNLAVAALVEEVLAYAREDDAVREEAEHQLRSGLSRIGIDHPEAGDSDVADRVTNRLEQAWGIKTLYRLRFDHFAFRRR